MENIYLLGYLVSISSFLLGLKFMSSPKRAKSGNLIAASGMILALVLSITSGITSNMPAGNLYVLSFAVFAGSIVGKKVAGRVEMTQMPQMVSLFNATGGACALLIGIVEASQNPAPVLVQLCLFAGISTGGIAVTGSITAYFKLSGKNLNVNSSSLLVLKWATLALLLLLPVLVLVNPGIISLEAAVYIIAFSALAYGFLLVTPIGGADMPVVISFLNSITGIATAFAGLVYHSYVMIVGGILVGAAGTLLTLLMCRAMNRSFLKVLSGNFKKAAATGAVREQHIQEIAIPELAYELTCYKKIAIVPGYGLAVAQAQHLCGQLQQLLEVREIQVDFVIHPVAGRMPGHMNVLLAEANIDYAHLKEMDEVNEDMESYDLTLIIGANDVVNPAAENDEESPVYGMPIIKSYLSKKVVVMKRSMGTGYAGVQNGLFELENCFLLFGDAKNSLTSLVDQLKLFSE